MTDLTRRDALMLTAAIAATTSSATVAEAADTPPSTSSQNELLTVPTGAVANTSIPISLQIPVKTFAPDGVMPKSVQIKLTMSAKEDPTHPVLTATLQDMALPVFTDPTSTPAISLMTRLKIGMNKIATTASPPQTTVTATLTMIYAGSQKMVTASQPVTIKSEDCAASDISVLRLSLQPPTVQLKGTSVVVRSIVPPVAAVKPKAAAPTTPAPAPSAPPPAASTTPPPSTPPSAAVTPTPSPTPSPAIPLYKLTQVLCTKDSDTGSNNPFFVLKDVDDGYLSPEVFVGFSVFAGDKSQQIRMEWSYADASPPPAAAPAAAPAPAPAAVPAVVYTLKASGLVVVTG